MTSLEYKKIRWSNGTPQYLRLQQLKCVTTAFILFNETKNIVENLDSKESLYYNELFQKARKCFFEIFTTPNLSKTVFTTLFKTSLFELYKNLKIAIDLDRMPPSTTSDKILLFLPLVMDAAEMFFPEEQEGLDEIVGQEFGPKRPWADQTWEVDCDLILDPLEPPTSPSIKVQMKVESHKRRVMKPCELGKEKGFIMIIFRAYYLLEAFESLIRVDNEKATDIKHALQVFRRTIYEYFNKGQSEELDAGIMLRNTVRDIYVEYRTAQSYRLMCCYFRSQKLYANLMALRGTIDVLFEIPLEKFDVYEHVD